MQSLNDHTVVVVGGTGNVGPFVVRALLEREVTVVVPSRFEEKLGGLREHLSQHVGATDLGRLHTFVGNLSTETEATDLRQRITDEVRTPDAVLASLGNLVTTPSLLDASADDLRQALDAYLIANFVVARTFLPVLKDSGGTYVLLQGPLAFELHPEFGTDLISIATAGQHMLFRALAQELEETRARVIELVNYAFIRDRQSQPSSPLPGEAVGAFAAYLLSGAGEEVHGQSIHLRSLEQVAEVGLDTENL
jgi:NAD(P)-dependent dehydrogenase (short-subunit alcohol dehydrogenase family)